MIYLAKWRISCSSYGHIGPRSIMFDIKPRVVIIFWESHSPIYMSYGIVAQYLKYMSLGVYSWRHMQPQITQLKVSL
jgi:hypothetical protein